MAKSNKSETTPSAPKVQTIKAVAATTPAPANSDTPPAVAAEPTLAAEIAPEPTVKKAGEPTRSRRKRRPPWWNQRSRLPSRKNCATPS